MSDKKPTFRWILRHCQSYIINDKNAVCEEHRLKQICIKVHALLTKCMLRIQELNVALNVQSDSLRAKVFM